MRFSRLTLILLAVLCVSKSAAAATYNVCPAGCPFSNIQMAIDVAVDGDTVLLHDGHYMQRIDLDGKAVTVTSVNGPASTVLDGGEEGSVVLMTSGEGRDSVLEGLTVTNGQSTFGSGILISNSSPTIRNCVIVRNGYSNVGGGIYLSQSSPLIEDCVVEGNYAVHGGGIGMSYSSSQPLIRNTSISGNTAISYGGGIYCSESSAPVIVDSRVIGNQADYGAGLGAIESSHPDVTRTLFSNNTADSNGGGLWLGGAAITLTHSQVRGNVAYGVGGGLSVEERVATASSATLADCAASRNFTYSGGGIYVANSSLTVDRSYLQGNFAQDYGGGIYAVGSPCAVRDSILSGNTTNNYGGGLYVNSNTVTLTHCTLSANYAGLRGGAITASAVASLSIRNSILWNDGAGTANPEVYTTGLVSVDYSDVQGGITGWGTGTGNMDYDPYFVSPRSPGVGVAGDYRLQWISLCVDAGSAAYATPLDIHGDPRYQSPGPDMGADESALLYNGSFDAFEERRPTPWKARNLVAKDRRVTNEARSGDASFRITGGPGVKKLRQVKTLTGPTGFPITVGAWSKASGPTPAGGFYGLKVKVFYQDDTSKVYRVAFDKSSHDWQYREISFSAAYYYEKFVVDLVYADQTGRAWFDDVYLHAPAY